MKYFSEAEALTNAMLVGVGKPFVWFRQGEIELDAPQALFHLQATLVYPRQIKARRSPSDGLPGASLLLAAVAIYRRCRNSEVFGSFGNAGAVSPSPFLHFRSIGSSRTPQG